MAIASADMARDEILDESSLRNSDALSLFILNAQPYLKFLFPDMSVEEQLEQLVKLWRRLPEATRQQYVERARSLTQ